mmetsp:Transcript_74079/g.66664  ORF Transcript_74079/g.66664 Transcript_74079/m.66664 type:complete len:237 (-) Transcript_74079:221-931(-)
MGVVDIVMHALFIVIGYTVVSCCEWVFHKYCMHSSYNEKIPSQAFKNINRQHLIHHNATKTDMTLIPTVSKYEQYKLPMKYQEFQGLYFVWPVTITILIAFIIGTPLITFVLNKIVGIVGYNYSYLTSMVYGLLFCVYMNVAWNYVHPTIHFEKRQLKLCDEGLDLVPRYNWLENTGYYNFLWKNHVLHHLLSGKDAGNYNVTCPVAGDWLFNTYHTECDGYRLDVDAKKIYKLKD